MLKFNKLPSPDQRHMDTTSFLNENDGLEMESLSEHGKKSVEIIPIIQSLGCSEEDAFDVIAELQGFQSTLSDAFQNGDLEEMTNQASYLLDRTLPAELVIKTNQELGKLTAIERRFQGAKMMALVNFVNDIKRCMVEQKLMLAECDYYGINTLGRFENSPVNGQRTMKFINLLARYNLRDLQKQEFEQLSPFNYLRKAEIVAAHFSADPSKMLKYTQKQHEEDFMRVEYYLNKQCLMEAKQCNPPKTDDTCNLM